MPIFIKKKAPAPVVEPLVTSNDPYLYDEQCLRVLKRYPNTIVAWFLMASYAYYIEDDPILSDGLYDKLAKTMLEAWDDIYHMHKKYISIDDLRAGSLFSMAKEAYPPMAVGALRQLRQDYPLQTKSCN